MIKKLLLLPLATSLLYSTTALAIKNQGDISSSTTSTEEGECFSTDQRPEDLLERIENAYRSLVGDTGSNWGIHNGAEGYYPFCIEDSVIIDTIINTAPPEQTEFHFADFGAGNFQWVDAVSKHLRDNHSLSSHNFYVYGFRGESTSEDFPCYQDVGNVHSRKHGAVKLEMWNSGEASDPSSGITFDYITSNWTFRHLADPAGTFHRVYNTLKPNGGIVFTNGFIMWDKTEHKNFSDIEENGSFHSSMINYLSSFNEPMILDTNRSGRSIPGFMMQRTSASAPVIPMTYSGCYPAQANTLDLSGSQVNSNTVTAFQTSYDKSDLYTMIIGTGTALRESDDGQIYYTKNITGFIKGEEVEIEFINVSKNPDNRLFNWLLENKVIYKKAAE